MTTPNQCSRANLVSLLGQSRIPGLDFLRALAVMMVLVSHAGGFEIGGFPLVNGGLGVEIFFVLSGFLITSMLLTEWASSGQIRLKPFFQRRAARLLPVFYLYLFVGVCYLLVRHKGVPWGAVAASSVYLLNYYQALNGAPTHFLSHCWSLAVEEQFYVVWPLLLLFLNGRKIKLEIALPALIGILWIYRAVLVLNGWASDEYLYRALDTRSDHLLMGCWLAVLLKLPVVAGNLDRLASRSGVLMVITGTLLASGAFQIHFLYKYLIAYAIEPILIAIAIPLVVIAAGQTKQSLFSQLVNARPIVIVGQISYGIYLFHQLLMHALHTFIFKMTGFQFASWVISISLIVALAYLSFVYFETPLRNRFRPASH